MNRRSFFRKSAVLAGAGATAVVALPKQGEAKAAAPASASGQNIHFEVREQDSAIKSGGANISFFAERYKPEKNPPPQGHVRFSNQNGAGHIDVWDGERYVRVA